MAKCKGIVLGNAFSKASYSVYFAVLISPITAGFGEEKFVPLTENSSMQILHTVLRRYSATTMRNVYSMPSGLI